VRGVRAGRTGLRRNNATGGLQHDPLRRELLDPFHELKHNPVIRDFAKRLEAAGKKGHTIMTACARKLLVILNAMVRSGTPWSLSP